MNDIIELHWIPAGALNTRPDLKIDKSQFSTVFGDKSSDSTAYSYLCATHDRNVVGVAKVFSNPACSNIHIDFIEVAENARHRGVAGKMLGELFKYADSHNKVLTGDGYTELGRKYLLPLIQEREKNGTSFSSIAGM